MAVVVTDGFAWMKDERKNGCVCWLDTFEETGDFLTLPIKASSSSQNRIDRIVISWTPAGYVNRPEIIVLTGTPASSPIPPEITNNGATRQISIAKINVPVGASAITADMITDERLNAAVCGIVTESVSVDTSMAQSQFDALLLIYTRAIQNAITENIQPHNFTHFADGTDPITPADIGAAAEMIASQNNNTSINITLSDNYKYNFTNVSNLSMNVSDVKARGFIKFASSISTPKITAKAKTGNDITEAKPNETWEFNTEDGFVIFENWGVV
jgi:hypothetical protein